MAGEIFISFASKDVKVAMTLCAALESRGFSCWISARDIAPGANFQSSIVRALRHARIMLLVFTANSNNSEEMTKELALASQQKITVIPLRVEDVAPNDAFAYEFATRQWIDAFADWEFSIDQLGKRIGQQLELEAASQPRPGEPGPKTPERSVLVAEAPPAPVVALATAEENLQRPTRPRAVQENAPQAIDADVAETAVEEDLPEPRSSRRRLGIPIAIAAGLVIVVAVTAVSLLGSPPRSGPELAATPTPRLSTALVVQPEAPAAQPAPAPEQEPRLVKTNRRKSDKSGSQAPAEDIPY